MYVDVEIISNNTYQHTLFTYKVPKQLLNKISCGSIVNVPFRNKEYNAVVLSKSNTSNVNNIKFLNKYLNMTLDANQIKYLKQLAISNRLNIGILIHNLFDLSKFIKQNSLRNNKIENITLAKLEDIKQRTYMGHT